MRATGKDSLKLKIFLRDIVCLENSESRNNISKTAWISELDFGKK